MSAVHFVVYPQALRSMACSGGIMFSVCSSRCLSRADVGSPTEESHWP